MATFDFGLLYLGVLIKFNSLGRIELVGANKAILKDLVIDFIMTEIIIRFAFAIKKHHRSHIAICIQCAIPLEEVCIDKQSKVIHKEHALLFASVSRFDSLVKVTIFGKDLAVFIVNLIEVRDLVALIDKSHHPDNAIEVFGKANTIAATRQVVFKGSKR